VKIFPTGPSAELIFTGVFSEASQSRNGRYRNSRTAVPGKNTFRQLELEKKKKLPVSCREFFKKFGFMEPFGLTFEASPSKGSSAGLKRHGYLNFFLCRFFRRRFFRLCVAIL